MKEASVKEAAERALREPTQKIFFPKKDLLLTFFQRKTQRENFEFFKNSITQNVTTSAVVLEQRNWVCVLNLSLSIYLSKSASTTSSSYRESRMDVDIILSFHTQNDDVNDSIKV